MAAQRTPTRPQVHPNRHYSTLLREVKCLFEKLDSLLSTIATTVRTELQNHENRQCIAIYGLPEDEDEAHQVNCILACASLAPHHVTVLHRLGKPRLDGFARPLKIKLHISLPRLIDLSAKLCSDPLMKSFHVR